MSREQDPRSRDEPLRHVLAVVEPPSDGGTPAEAATRLAKNHGAELTLLFPLTPVTRVLPAGTEGMAQQEELAQAEPRLEALVEAARGRGVRTRGLVREADREEGVSALLEAGLDADLLVVPAVRSSAWDVFAGRLLERLARRQEPPVLAVHAGDPLRFGGSLKIVVPVWEPQDALATATRAGSLLREGDAAPSFVFVRVRGDGEGDPSSDLAALATGLRERGFEASVRVESGATADALAEVAREEVAGLVAIDPEARQRIWPLRGALGRLAPRLSLPVLAV